MSDRSGYFNDDQNAYMDYLATLPPEAKCKCLWYPRGKCPNCKPEDGGKPPKAEGV